MLPDIVVWVVVTVVEVLVEVVVGEPPAVIVNVFDTVIVLRPELSFAKPYRV